MNFFELVAHIANLAATDAGALGPFWSQLRDTLGQVVGVAEIGRPGISVPK